MLEAHVHLLKKKIDEDSFTPFNLLNSILAKNYQENVFPHLFKLYSCYKYPKKYLKYMRRVVIMSLTVFSKINNAVMLY